MLPLNKKKPKSPHFLQEGIYCIEIKVHLLINDDFLWGSWRRTLPSQDFLPEVWNHKKILSVKSVNPDIVGEGKVGVGKKVKVF